MLVWDALFAHGQGLQLVEHMAVAMLLYVRATLLEGDPNRSPNPNPNPNLNPSPNPNLTPKPNP